MSDDDFTEEAPDPIPLDDDPESLDELLAGDIELAYQRALEASDAAELELQAVAPAVADETDNDVETISPEPSVGEAADSDDTTAPPTNEPERESRVTPEEVIEAVLFVGGEELTTRKLRSLFHNELDTDLVDQVVETLNRRYIDERRPYEIRFGTGGYRLALREEFESIRNRVFGVGPRDVKLSQDALEVLALVAYKQPISAREIEAEGKSKPNGVLRQLVRRELIRVDREEQRGKDVSYRTTDRFLSVFGLGSIDELPTANALAFK